MVILTSWARNTRACVRLRQGCPLGRLCSGRREQGWRSVAVVGGAGAFGGDHGRAERVFGRATRAVGGASVGFQQAAQDFAGAAFGGGSRRGGFRGETDVGIEISVFGAEGPSAGGENAEAAPFAVDDAEDAGKESAGGGIAVGAGDAFVGVLDVGASGFELGDAAVDAAEEVERFEAGDDDGDAEAAGERFVVGLSHDGADMAGGEEALHLVVGGGEDGVDGRRDEDVGDEEGEVGEVFAVGEFDGEGVDGGGGFEADGEEDDVASWVFAGDAEAVEGRVDHADVGAGGLGGEEVGRGAGDAQHVAVGTEDDFGTTSESECAVDEGDRCDADRATGAVDQVQAGG